MKTTRSQTSKLVKIQQIKIKAKLSSNQFPIAKLLSMKDVVKQNNNISDSDGKLSRKLLNEIKSLQTENKVLRQNILTLEEQNKFLIKMNQQHQQYINVMNSSRNILKSAQKIAVNIKLSDSFAENLDSDKQSAFALEKRFDDQENKGSTSDLSSKASYSQFSQANNIAKKLKTLESEVKQNIYSYQLRIDQLKLQNVQLQSKCQYYKGKFKESSSQLKTLLKRIDSGMVRS